MTRDEVKAHFRKHKTIYISIGCSVVVAGITVVIMRDQLSKSAKDSIGDTLFNQSISRGIPVTASRGIPVTGENSGSVFTKQVGVIVSNRMSITQIIDSYRQGAPSWVVRCIETGEAFMSQRAAAKAMELSEAELSRHLKGNLDHVRGFTFERICLAA